jgi:outer membrane protein OmpA-like peptidoglycan-associated protein
MRFVPSPVMAPLPLTAILLAAAGILSACAAQPTHNDQLEQARIAVSSLEQDPDGQAAAAQQLSNARASLQRANEAFEQGQSPEEVTHLAYLADRQAATGTALADEFRARRELANTSEERSSILLQARTEEAQRARQELADLKARQTPRGLELTLSSDVLFNTGSAELKPGANLQISRLANFMHSSPNTRVMIEGHTDSTGSMAFNDQLSAHRAQSVAVALETQGITRDRIETVGRGQHFPIASNETSAGREQNRRVDIILSDTSGQFARGANQGPVVR